MASIFFTGFPGFLGSELLPRILARSPEAKALCLVQPKFLAVAQSRAAAIVVEHPSLAGRIELLEGDLTQPLKVAARDVVEVFHLAAIYDLAVRREPAMKVNVEGTRNVLEFAGSFPSLVRFHYVSTCYVSGRFEGRFLESDLQMGQRFNNYYEETKYLAEVEVQAAMKKSLPATVYRPAVVVGDSSSGATQKYDGPYYVMQWVLRQPRIAILPVLGSPRRYTFNVVPRDFIIGAIDTLSASAATKGKVYQLADPDPMTIDETIDAIAAATGRTIVRIPMPRALAKGALQYVPGVYRLMRIPPPAVDYFVHPTSYDTSETQSALAGTGLEVPRFRDYLPRLVEFVRRHPEVGAAAMA